MIRFGTWFCDAQHKPPGGNWERVSIGRAKPTKGSHGTAGYLCASIGCRPTLGARMLPSVILNGRYFLRPPVDQSAELPNQLIAI
jgi:hypothetical protein